MYTPSEISNLELLSSYLRTTPTALNKLVNGNKAIIDLYGSNNIKVAKSKDKFDLVFQKFYIPKKNKKLGYRIVYKTWDQTTRDILKVLKYNLDELYSPLDCVHGFVSNRNTKTNASFHLNKKLLLKLDIKNFFESIKIDLVADAFRSLGFIDKIAIDLSKTCTLENRLVQGFSTSPIIANMVCTEIDKKIHDLCTQNDAVYTRYADDISISSDSQLPSVDKVKLILKSLDLELNDLKTRKFKRGQNHYVTGLSISDNLHPRIPKPIKQRLRQQLYYLKLHGYHSHICHLNEWDESTDHSVTSEFSTRIRNRLKGWIDYTHSIEPELAKKYYKLFDEIEKTEYENQKAIYEKFKKENGGIIEIKMEREKPILKKK